MDRLELFQDDNGAKQFVRHGDVGAFLEATPAARRMRLYESKAGGKIAVAEDDEPAFAEAHRDQPDAFTRLYTVEDQGKRQHVRLPDLDAFRESTGFDVIGGMVPPPAPSQGILSKAKRALVWPAAGPVSTPEPKTPEEARRAEIRRMAEAQAEGPGPGSMVGGVATGAGKGAVSGLGDAGLALAKGVVGVPQLAVGLANIPTMGAVGKGLEAVGVDFKKTQEALDGWQSDDLRGRREEFAQAESVGGKLAAVAASPQIIAQTTLESLPTMFAGGAIGGAVGAAFPKLAGFAGAIGEGLASAGQALEQVRAENPSGYLTPKQIGVLTGSGVLTGAIGALGGRAAKWLKIADVDTLAAGGVPPAVKAGILRRVVGGMVSEGLLEELPQSLQEQVAQNLAQGKPWSQGVADAAILGAFSGAVMGGAGNLATSSTTGRGNALPPKAGAKAEAAPAPDTSPLGTFLGMLTPEARKALDAAPAAQRGSMVNRWAAAALANPQDEAGRGALAKVFRDPAGANAFLAGIEQEAEAAALAKAQQAEVMAQEQGQAPAAQAVPTAGAGNAISPAAAAAEVAVAEVAANPAAVLKPETADAIVQAAAAAADAVASGAAPVASVSAPTPAAVQPEAPAQEGTQEAQEEAVQPPAAIGRPEAVEPAAAPVVGVIQAPEAVSAPAAGYGEMAAGLGIRFDGVQEGSPEPVQFTDTQEGSPAFGASFYVPEGATADQVAAKLAEKREAFAEGERKAKGARPEKEKAKRGSGPAYLREVINYGGERRTRGDVIAEMQAAGTPQARIDAYMMGAKAVRGALPEKATAVPERVEPQAAAKPTAGKPPELMTPDEWAASQYQKGAPILGQLSSPKTRTKTLRGPSMGPHYAATALDAVEARKPILAANVDAYGITLPAGYVREGDRYVFKPSAPAAQAPKPQAPPAREAVSGPVAARPESATTEPIRQGGATSPMLPPPVTKKEKRNALPVKVSDGVLQRAPEGTGTPGGERGRVEQGQQGQAAAGAQAVGPAAEGQPGPKVGALPKKATTLDRTRSLYAELEPDRDMSGMAQKIADAIDAKDADTLRSWVMHGRGFNDTTKKVVFRIIGKPVPSSMEEMGKEIDKWAGVSVEERAESERQKESERQAKREAREAEARQKKEASWKASVEGREVERAVAYLSGLDAMQRGAAIAALNKQFRFPDGVRTRREQVEKLVAAGAQLDTRSEPGVKPMSRTRFNRADNQQQAAHEKRMREAGMKTAYYVGNFDLGKHAYDYAQHLKKAAPSETPAPSALPASESAPQPAAAAEQEEAPQPAAEARAPKGEAITPQAVALQRRLNAREFTMRQRFGDEAFNELVEAASGLSNEDFLELTRMIVESEPIGVEGERDTRPLNMADGQEEIDDAVSRYEAMAEVRQAEFDARKDIFAATDDNAAVARETVQKWVADNKPPGMEDALNAAGIDTNDPRLGTIDGKFTSGASVYLVSSPEMYRGRSMSTQKLVYADSDISNDGTPQTWLVEIDNPADVTWLSKDAEMIGKGEFDRVGEGEKAVASPKAAQKPEPVAPPAATALPPKAPAKAAPSKSALPPKATAAARDQPIGDDWQQEFRSYLQEWKSGDAHNYSELVSRASLAMQGGMPASVVATLMRETGISGDNYTWALGQLKITANAAEGKPPPLPTDIPTVAEAQKAVDEATAKTAELREALRMAEVAANTYERENGILMTRAARRGYSRVKAGDFKQNVPKAKRDEYIRLKKAWDEADAVLDNHYREVEQPAKRDLTRAHYATLARDQQAPAVSRLVAQAALIGPQTDTATGLTTTDAADAIEAQAELAAAPVAREVYPDATDDEIKSLAPEIVRFARTEAMTGAPLTVERLREVSRRETMLDIRVQRRARLLGALKAAGLAQTTSRDETRARLIPVEGYLPEAFNAERDRLLDAATLTAAEVDAFIASIPAAVKSAQAKLAAQQAEQKAKDDAAAAEEARIAALPVEEAPAADNWKPASPAKKPGARDDVLKAVTKGKQSLQILKMMHVKNKVGTTTDLDVTVSMPVDLPDGMYTQPPKSKTWIKNMTDMADFPPIPEAPKDAHKLTFSGAQAVAFRKGLRAAQDAQSGDPTRRVLNGVLLEVRAGQAHFVATDGRRLHQGNVGKVNFPDVQVIIPMKSVDVILKSNGAGPIVVRIAGETSAVADAFTADVERNQKWLEQARAKLAEGKGDAEKIKKQVEHAERTVADFTAALKEAGTRQRIDPKPTIWIEDGNSVIATKVIDGVYPNYRQVIPAETEQKAQIIVDRKALGQAVADVTPFVFADPEVPRTQGTKRIPPTLRITFGPKSIRVLAANGAKQYHRQKDVAVSSVVKGGKFDPIVLSADGDYFLEALGQSDAPTVKIGLVDGHSPMQFSAPDGNSDAVLMPLRVSARGDTTAASYQISKPTGERNARIENLPQSTDARELEDVRRLCVQVSQETGTEFRAVPIGHAAHLATNAELDAVSAMERVFAKRVVFYRTPATQAFNPNGIASPANPDVIFINVESDSPILKTMGHELVHHMRRDAEALYVELMNNFADIAKDFGAYRAEYRVRAGGRNDSPFVHQDELLADIVGNHLLDPRFWDAMAAKNPPLLQRLAQYVQRWLATARAQIVAAIGGRLDVVARFTKDAGRAREIVADALAKYATGREGLSARGEADMLAGQPRGVTRQAFADALEAETAGMRFAGENVTASERDDDAPLWAQTGEGQAARATQQFTDSMKEDYNADHIIAIFNHAGRGYSIRSAVRAGWKAALDGAARETVAQTGNAGRLEGVGISQAFAATQTFKGIHAVASQLGITAIPITQPSIGNGVARGNIIFIPEGPNAAAIAAHEIGHVLYTRGNSKVRSLVSMVDTDSAAFGDVRTALFSNQKAFLQYYLMARVQLGMSVAEAETQEGKDRLEPVVQEMIANEITMGVLSGRKDLFSAYADSGEAKDLAVSILSEMINPSGVQAARGDIRYYRSRNGVIRAMTMGNRSHFFLNRYDNASQLRQDIREEAAHRLINELGGKEWRAVGTQVYGGMRYAQIVNEIRKNYGLQPGTEAFNHELVAKMVRDGQNNAPLWRRVLDAVAAALRRAGRALGLNLSLSDAELRSFANGLLRAKERQMARGGPVQARIRQGDYNEQDIADYIAATENLPPEDGSRAGDDGRSGREREAIGRVRAELARQRGGQNTVGTQGTERFGGDEGFRPDRRLRAVTAVAGRHGISVIPVKGMSVRGMAFMGDVFLRDSYAVETTGLHEIGHVLIQRKSQPLLDFVAGIDVYSPVVANRVEDVLADQEWKDVYEGRARNALGPSATADEIRANVLEQCIEELAMEALEGKDSAMRAFRDEAEARRLRAAALSEILQPGSQQAEKRGALPPRAGTDTRFARATPTTGPPGRAIVTPEQDREYMAAVERGDMETAQRMVDEAAKRAGYNVGPVWHGTRTGGFTEFDASRQGDTDVGHLGKGFYFATSPQTADIYTWGAKKPRVITAHLSIRKLLDLRQPLTEETAMSLVESANRKRARLGKSPLDNSREYAKRLMEAYNAAETPLSVEKKRYTLIENYASNRQLQELGYDGVRSAVELVVFDPAQIKSADAITRDDQGRVIPPSERFNPQSTDIRYARGEAPAPQDTPPAKTSALPAKATRMSRAQRQAHSAGKAAVFKALRPIMTEARKQAATRQPGALPQRASVSVALNDVIETTDQKITGMKGLLGQIAKTVHAAEKNTATGISEVQAEYVKLLNAVLPKEEIGASGIYKQIVKAQTFDDLVEALPEVKRTVDAWERRELRLDIKKLYNRFKDSSVIDVAYRGRIKAAMDPYIMDRPSGRKWDAIWRVMVDAIAAASDGTDTGLDLDQLTALANMTKTPLADLSKESLIVLRDQMAFLAQLGKLTLTARRAAMLERAREDARTAIYDLKPYADYSRIIGATRADMSAADRWTNFTRFLRGSISTIDMAMSPVDSTLMSMSKGERDLMSGLMRVVKHPLAAAWGRAAGRYADFSAGLVDKANDLGITHADQWNRIGILGISEQNTGGDPYYGRKKLYNTFQTKARMEFERKTGLKPTRSQEDTDAVRAIIDGYIDKAISEVTPQEREMLGWLRDQMDPLLPQVNRILKELQNRELTKEDFYFPLMTDWDAAEASGFADQFRRYSEDELLAAPSGRRAEGGNRKTSEPGAAKDRVGVGYQPVNFNAYTVVTRHMNDVLYFIEMEPVLRHLAKVVAQPEFKEAMGPERLMFVAKLMDLASRHGGTKASQRLAWMDMLRNLLGAGQLAGSPSMTAVQLSQSIYGMAENGVVGTLEAAAELTSSGRLREFVRSMSPVVRLRMGPDQAWREAGIGKLTKAAARIGFWPGTKLDRATAEVNWLAGYKRSLRDQGIAWDSSNPVRNETAANLANAIVARTSASANPLDLPPLLSMSKNVSLAKTAFQFQTPLFYIADFLRRDMLQGFGREPLKAVGLFMAMLLAAVYEYSVRQVISEYMFPKDKPLRKPKGLEKAIYKRVRENLDQAAARDVAAFASGTASTMFGNFPVLGNLKGIVVYQGAGFPVADWFRDAIQGGYQSVAGATPESRGKGLGRVVEAGAAIIPGGKQVARAAKAWLPEKAGR